MHEADTGSEWTRISFYLSWYKHLQHSITRLITPPLLPGPGFRQWSSVATKKTESCKWQQDTGNSIFQHVTKLAFLFDQTHKQVNIICSCPYTASFDDVKTSQTSFKFSRTIIRIIYPPEWDNGRMGHSDPAPCTQCIFLAPGQQTSHSSQERDSQCREILLQLNSQYLILGFTMALHTSIAIIWLCHEVKCGLCSLDPKDNFNNFVSHGSFCGGNKVIRFFKHSLGFLMTRLKADWIYISRANKRCVAN